MHAKLDFLEKCLELPHARIYYYEAINNFYMVNRKSDKTLKIPVNYPEEDVVIPEIKRNGKLVVPECICNIQQSLANIPLDIDDEIIFNQPIK